MSGQPSGQRLTFQAADGTHLAGTWHSPGRPGTGGVLLLPGYWRRADSPRLSELAATIARRFPVLSLDFRGHGGSGGSFTFGRSEHLDVEAALEEMRRRGIDRAVLLGLSMGGSAAIVALGRSAPLPVTPAGIVSIAAPSHFGLIRPAPWRGGRDVAWSDAWRMPRTSVPSLWAGKLVPAEHAPSLPEMPIRLLHARHDWLVDHRHSERLHAACGARAEMLLLEEHGLHADELLGRARGIVHRLTLPFIAAALEPGAGTEAGAQAGAQAGAGEGTEVDPGPWQGALPSLLGDPARHSADLGGLPLGGAPSRLRAFAARDGAHLAFLAGDDPAWARGLRDGSVHGLNLLATQLVTDGAGWSPQLRAALQAALAGLRGADAAARRFVVERRGRDGLQARADDAA